MYSRTSGDRPAMSWLRFSSAMHAAMFGVSRFAHMTSLVMRRPTPV